MKNKLAVLRSRTAQLTAAASALVLGGVSSAQAALPAGATGAFTTLQTDGLELIDLAWVPIVAFTSGFIVIKLFKKAASKIG